MEGLTLLWPLTRGHAGSVFSEIAHLSRAVKDRG